MGRVAAVRQEDMQGTREVEAHQTRLPDGLHQLSSQRLCHHHRLIRDGMPCQKRVA